MAGFKWSAPPQSVWPAGAATYVSAVKRGVHGACQRHTPEAENFMKTTAPWTDRTANARQTLYCRVEPPSAAAVTETIEVIFAHGMIYGWYLEGWDYINQRTTQQGDKYAIIQPALDRYGPKIWREIRGLFR